MTSSKDCDSHLSGCEDEIVEFENITVKLSISDAQVVAQIYPNCMTIEEVKKDIARKFEVDPKLLIICQCGKVLNDDSKLYDAERNDYGIYELTLGINEIKDAKENTPILNLDIYYNKSRLPDFITVHIPAEDTSDGNSKDIVVEIENQAITKPFIGGYRDKRTGIEYHDAFTLTGPNFQKFKINDLATRITQTRELKVKLNDTTADQSTQSFGDATNIIFVSAATDFVIIPRKYQTYAQKIKREDRLAKIVLIQKNFRRYLLWRYIKRCAAEYRSIVTDRLEVERKFNETEVKKRIYRENAVKNFPHTKEDFGLLYAHVEKWKQAEMKRIAKMYSGAPRLAEVNILLDKEIQLLNGIERQRTVVRKAMKDFRENQLLQKMGEPIKWIGYKDKVIEMDLIRTQRVRFLAEVLKDLKKDLPKEKRLSLLNSVDKLLEDEKDFPQVSELHDLIDREKNLLIFTKHCDVSILRQRFLIIFLDLIKFNKEGKTAKAQKRMCDCCKQVKSISEFALRTRQNAVDTCQLCFSLKTAVADNTVYKAILRSIQREERKHRSLASYAFILQEDDVRFIVDKIWHRHSFLSKENDINYLRLPRWIKSDDWSPWNCICLTETEARNHNTLKDLRTVYDEKMMLDITNRHMLAKNAFKKLQDVENDFVESGQWWEVGIKNKVV
ncbi:IQ and ubiquitin-like domain-containing protein [Episyrphus balteatus]|uniref:IQ and ubiquitin-like domain-containing protein n=1 Tax=Episyrphus balteatus TaxID=286459 RepID=UPI002485DCB3|nr:IQ and ubiquitin-like domain-containing protein [Episyrphus balteatus]